MKEYELLYLVPSSYTEKEVEEIQGQIKTLAESMDAKVLRNESLGKLKLAYPIKKMHHGTYVLMHFNAEGSILAELDRKLKLTDEVLRHMIVNRLPGALEKKFELSEYVPPINEEGKKTRLMDKPARPAAPAATPAPAAVPAKAEETAPVVAEEPMSMEQLDQKLDKILDGDIEQNI